MQALCTLPVLLFIGLLSACSGISDTRPDVIRSSERMLERGVNAYINSDYAGATDFFSRALTHYRSIDHRQGMLFSHINLAETALVMGHYPGAEQHLAQAESLAREQGNVGQSQRVMLLQAQLAWRQRQQEKAELILNTLNAEQEQQGISNGALPLAILSLHTEMAFSTLDEDTTQAKLWLERFETTIKRSSDSSPLYQARLQRFQAQLLQQQGEYEQAAILREAALGIYREAALRPAIAATLAEHADAMLAQQRYAEAEQALQRALYIRIWMLDRHNSRELLRQLASVQALQGKDATQNLDYARHIQLDETRWQSLRQQVKPR
jgi:tetratricopeptide (TPR) repeat protein